MKRIIFLLFITFCIKGLSAQICIDSYPINQWTYDSNNNPEALQWVAFAIYAPPIVKDDRFFQTNPGWVLGIDDPAPLWKACVLNTSLIIVNPCAATGHFSTPLCKYTTIDETDITFISPDIMEASFLFTAGDDNECCTFATGGVPGGGAGQIEIGGK